MKRKISNAEVDRKRAAGSRVLHRAAKPEPEIVPDPEPIAQPTPDIAGEITEALRQGMSELAARTEASPAPGPKTVNVESIITEREKEFPYLAKKYTIRISHIT